jgi:DNA processing protein
LAQNGVVIVSGLARGIDSAAHQGALSAKGINIAVLGCGVDVVYPRENRVLMEQIIATGAVISEYPLGSPPEAWHFPQRNRIISGLAQATLVVEAGERSGALITADCALEQGREVLAVPGNISSPASKGPNRLIKQGAGLVESVEDILEEIGAGSLFKADTAKTPSLPRLTAEEEKVYRQLSHESVHLDDLALRSNLPVQDVLAVLMYLELKGLVRQLPGKFYTLRL